MAMAIECAERVASRRMEECMFVGCLSRCFWKNVVFDNMFQVRWLKGVVVEALGGILV